MATDFILTVFRDVVASLQVDLGRGTTAPRGSLLCVVPSNTPTPWKNVFTLTSPMLGVTPVIKQRARDALIVALRRVDPVGTVVIVDNEESITVTRVVTDPRDNDAVFNWDPRRSTLVVRSKKSTVSYVEVDEDGGEEQEGLKGGTVY